MQADEIYQHIQEHLCLDDPHSLTETLLFQQALAKQQLALLTPELSTVSLPVDLIGEHSIVDSNNLPISSTGGILFIDPEKSAHTVALKYLNRWNLNQEEFEGNPHPFYLLDNPVARLMCLVGELLEGQVANIDSSLFYFGLGGMEIIGPGKINLSQLNIEKVFSNQQEPVLVMERMPQDLFMFASELKRQGLPQDQLIRESRKIINRIITSSFPLSNELAWETCSPQALRTLFLERTVYSLVENTSQVGAIPEAVALTEKTLSVFEQFFDLPETTSHLIDRINNQQGPTYGPGDTKWSNILVKLEQDQLRTVMSDAQSLIVRPGITGKERPEFAPWPLTDIIIVLAYMAMQPYALGLDETMTAIRQEIKAVSEAWSDWHELYFNISIAYRLLVDSACNVDMYEQQYREHQNSSQPKNEYITMLLEDYPKLAFNLAQDSMTTYLSKKTHA